MPKINKVKTGRKIRRNKEDENTKKYISEDDNLRMIADAGGEDIIRRLEFTSIAKVEGRANASLYCILFQYKDAF